MKKQWLALFAVLILCTAWFAGCDGLESNTTAESFSVRAGGVSGPYVEGDENETGVRTEERTGVETDPTEDNTETPGNAYGIKVMYGETVRKGPGALSYTPAPGSGYFLVNGAITINNGITMSINAVGILDYRLSTEVAEDMDAKVEIRVSKNDQLLIAYAQDNVHLTKGICQIDACVDTGESVKCSGMYEVKFYINDRLVSKTMEYV